MPPIRRPAAARSRQTPYATAVSLPDRLLVALPFLLAEHVLLDLAGRGSGQLAELDLCRAFEFGEVLAAEPDQVLLGDVLAWLEFDERLRPLAPLLVGRGHDGGLEHGRMLGDRLLHLDARDGLPARDDDVLRAGAQRDVALGA